MICLVGCQSGASSQYQVLLVDLKCKAISSYNKICGFLRNHKNLHRIGLSNILEISLDKKPLLFSFVIVLSPVGFSLEGGKAEKGCRPFRHLPFCPTSLSPTSFL
jgi:hypothetical protein